MTMLSVPAHASPDTSLLTSPRCESTKAPGPVTILSGVPSSKDLRDGVPIRISYKGNLKVCSTKPEGFTLYAMNPASAVFELTGVSLGDCRQRPKTGATCTFRDVPSAWSTAARVADRVAVAAYNAVGEGPRDTMAGAWLADSRIIAQCILDAGEEQAKEVKLTLAGVIGGTLGGLIPLPGADFITGPVLESGITSAATLAITGSLTKAAEDFMETLATSTGEDASDELIKSENKLLRRVGKGLKGYFMVATVPFVIKDYKDAYDTYFIEEEACRGIS